MYGNNGIKMWELQLLMFLNMFKVLYHLLPCSGIGSTYYTQGLPSCGLQSSRETYPCEETCHEIDREWWQHKSNTVNYILDYWKICISRNTFWFGSWKRIKCPLCKLRGLETIGWGCLWLNWESPVLGNPKNVEWSQQRAGVGRKMEEKSWKTLFCHRNELGLYFLNCILVNQERLLQQLSISIFWKQFYINIIAYSNVMIHEWVVG